MGTRILATRGMVLFFLRCRAGVFFLLGFGGRFVYSARSAVFDGTGPIEGGWDVLIDQLVQMSRSGIDVAVLRAGVDIADAQRQFDRFSGFYQADAVNTQPLFARQAA